MLESKVIESLYEYAVNAAGFQDIIDHFFELTGVTAAATDAMNRMIAATPDVRAKYGSGCSWNDVVNSEPHCLLREISYDGIILMNLAVACQNEPDDGIYHLVSVLANILYAAWFRLRYTSFNMHGNGSGLLLSLLRGDMHMFTESPCGPFFAAVIPSSQANQAGLVFDILSSAEGDELLFAHDNDEYIYLINADDVPISKLNNFAKQHHLIIGISQTFTDIEKASRYRLQASSAAAAAARFPEFSGCASFDDMKLFVMFDVISGSDAGISMTDPQVELLAKSDNEKNTGFMRTLFCWLLNSQHAAAAAKQLGIHRNTLDNRLSKINELIDADWNNCSYCTCMLYSLYITLDKLGQLEYFEFNR